MYHTAKCVSFSTKVTNEEEDENYKLYMYGLQTTK